MTVNNSDEFLEYVLDALGIDYCIKHKKMFGGYGLYIHGKIFALIIDCELYFKAHNENAAQFFKANGSEPFTYERKGKLISMCYWKVGPEILDEHENTKKWIEMALEDNK